MSANSDRTFQPRLESFEARCLPSMVPFFFQLLHARLRPQVLPPTSPVVRAAAVRNIFNPALVATFPTSLAAHGTAPAGGLNLTTSINSSPASLGLTGSSASPSSVQTGGLSLNPSSVGVTGSLFGSPPMTPTGGATAVPGTAGAVPTLVSSVGAAPSTVSVVPNTTNFGLTNPIPSASFTPHGTAGLARPGLITPAFLRSDPGIFLPT